MAYILNLETTTRNCSVSIAKAGETVVCMEVAEEGYSHAEKLHVFIEQTMQQAGITFQELKAVAVSQGPGSYTGLRIGVSAAKGLSYALNIPLLAIDTLEALSRKIQVNQGTIIPMLDARRMEVFSAFFDHRYNKIRETKAEIIDENTFAEFPGPLHLIGDGALKCKTVLATDKFVYHEHVIHPSANEMSSLSFAKYQQHDFVDVAYFEPFYLKDFVMTTRSKV